MGNKELTILKEHLWKVATIFKRVLNSKDDYHVLLFLIFVQQEKISLVYKENYTGKHEVILPNKEVYPLEIQSLFSYYHEILNFKLDEVSLGKLFNEIKAINKALFEIILEILSILYSLI